MKRYLVIGALVGWFVAHASQDSTCKAFVTCFEATGGTKGSLDSSFGAMGTCWSTTSERAQECQKTCVDQLNALSAKFPDAGCKDTQPGAAAEVMKRWLVVGALLGWLVAHASLPPYPVDCRSYVACWERHDEYATKGALDSTYGPTGNCWTSTTELAYSCNLDCINKLTVLRAKYPDGGCEPVRGPSVLPPNRGC